MSLKLNRKSVTAFLSSSFLLLTLAAPAFAQRSAAPVPPPQKAKVAAQLAALPLAFEANKGQADPSVKFLSRGPGYTMFLTRDAAVLSLQAGKDQADVLRLKVAGATTAAVDGKDQSPTITNYFMTNDRRNWRTNIANFNRVQYSSIYPGIDLLYYGKDQRLEHDFVVSPGADPRKITLEVGGAKQLRMDAEGNLHLGTAQGELLLQKPVIYQEKDGKRVEVAGGFDVHGNRVRFKVGEYDRTRTLIIDPVLNYSSYLNDSTAALSVTAIAVNGGNAYVTGTVPGSSSFSNLTIGTLFGSRGGTSDIFVTKFTTDGTSLIFFDVIGSANTDTVNAIAVDASGNAYITGLTRGAYPVPAGTFGNTRNTNGNGQDAVVSKISATGSSLLYSKFIGGNGDDVGTGIATFV